MKYQEIITFENEGERIDKYLCQYLDISRSKIQNLIKEEVILVNNEKTKSNYILKADDVVDWEYDDNEEFIVEAQDIPLEVAYEDDDVLVINKQKGLVVHPAVGNQQGTIVNALLYHYPNQLSTVNGPLRPGIVHRIDKDTSGLLLIAKNDKAHESLAEQLKSKEVSRKYYALVHGDLEHDFGTIDAPIGRDVKDRKRMCVCENNSKDARTHFKVIERFENYTLVECSLETGRTHQIRVHMKYIGHPVVGDETYAYRKTMKTQGQLLHAYELQFIQPTTNEEVIVQAKLPEIFENVLAELRRE